MSYYSYQSEAARERREAAEHKRLMENDPAYAALFAPKLKKEKTDLTDLEIKMLEGRD